MKDSAIIGSISSVVGRDNRGSTDGFLLRQRSSVGLAVLIFIISVLNLGLYVCFFDASMG